MRINQGASVLTSGGEDVGRVDRVVIDPRNRDVTHIVVRKGTLFTEDKVVPIDWVAEADSDRITLRESAESLHNLPDFQDTQYIPLNEEERRRHPDTPIYAAPPLYWYPTFGVPAMAYPAYGPDYVPYTTRTEENIPEGTVALKEGAKVISVDGKHVGDVDQVLTDPETGQATHFVISRGLLLKARKLIPLTWMDRVSEDEVRLAVGARILDELNEYKG